MSTVFRPASESLPPEGTFIIARSHDSEIEHPATVISGRLVILKDFEAVLPTWEWRTAESLGGTLVILTARELAAAKSALATIRNFARDVGEQTVHQMAAEDPSCEPLAGLAITDLDAALRKLGWG